jgi:hypothetical protein
MPPGAGLDRVGSYAAKADVNKYSNYSKYTVMATERYGDSCRNFTHPENSSPDGSPISGHSRPGDLNSNRFRQEPCFAASHLPSFTVSSKAKEFSNEIESEAKK